MSNFGFGFNRGQFGGGMRFPFGGGAAGQGGFQPRPFQGGMQIQQRPGFPGLQSNYRTLLHRPNQPPVQQIQQAARPMIPPVTRGAGGSFGAGAAIQGDVNGAGRLARPLMDNPAAFGGFLSVPPEPTRPTMPPNQFASNHPASSTASIFTQAGMMNPSQARQWSPQEQATMDRFSADQAMNRLQDANPNFRDNLAGSMERDRGIIEKGMVPDVNDPNFQGITPQQAFQQIPGNSFNIMRDRFDAIKANRPPVEPSMTASQATSTMPNYQQRLAQANPEMAQNISNPTYLSDNRITPMPRGGGRLTPQEAMQMQAVGSSAGDWRAKADWMASKGYQGEMTPQQAQEYTAERQQARLGQNDAIFNQKMKRIGQADLVREAKAKQAEQFFRRQNPELFATPDFTAAQLASSLGQGSLQRFSQPGLTPQEAIDAQLRVRQQGLQQAQTQAALGMDAEAEQTLRGLNGFAFPGGGMVPNQPPGGYSDPGTVMRRGQDHRKDDGSIDSNAFSTKLSAIMSSTPTARSLIDNGVSAIDLTEFIQNNRTMFADPVMNARLKLAEQALQILEGSQGGVSPTQPPARPQTQSQPIRQQIPWPDIGYGVMR